MTILLPTSRCATVLCLLPVFTVGLIAHDLYLLPDAFVVKAGSSLKFAIHNGDSFPESEGPPAMARLRDAGLLSASGLTKAQNLQILGKRAVGTVAAPNRDGYFLLSVHTVPNFIQLPPAQFAGYLKEEGLTKVIDWRSRHGESDKPGRERYSKFAKALLLSGAPNDFYQHPLGFPIEIIPEENPYKLHAGDRLPIRVLFRGKPAAGVQVEAAWSGAGKSKTTVIGKTDEAGRLQAPLAASGQWRLHSLMMERCADPSAADWESFWASLTFEVR